MSKPADTLSDALELAIVMPAYNEQECIAATVEAWLRVLAPLRGILVVVNDGSKDATGEILDRLLASNPKLRVIHQRNAGHGAAILRGYRDVLALNPKYIFQTDSDNQFSTEDFWKLWDVREEASFVSGIRRNRQDPLHRLLISRLLRTQLNFAFGVRVTDANIPFRLMRADFLRLALTVVPASSFAPNIFISILAKRVWDSHLEIPIRHLPRETGVVSIIGWKLCKICLRCTKELLQFRQLMRMQQRRLKESKGLKQIHVATS